MPDPKMDCRSFLQAQIKAEGAMPVDRFMQLCLSHPEVGYYARGDRFGRSGDFITAPEISQLFGEMMAGFLAYLWQASGQPAGGDIARFEAGPGRGTLFADMHKTYLKICPSLGDACPYFLENSPYLRAKITKAIAPQHPIFLDGISGLPAKPLFGIANEFFDALGVCQAIYKEGVWRWRAIDFQNGAFIFTDGLPLSDIEQQASFLNPAPSEGEICEYSALSETIFYELSQHIAQYGGGFLICDYGRTNGYGDSLQAVKSHAKTELLKDPGNCDITHLVDFSALARQAERAGARLIGPVAQGAFLTEIGITERAEALRRPEEPETDRMLLAALDRLCAAPHMGQIFKVALLVPNGSGMPLGFATAHP